MGHGVRGKTFPKTFASMKVWGRSRVTVWKRNFSYHIAHVENIKYISTLSKRWFQLHQGSLFFSLDPKTLRFFHFCWSRCLREIKDHSLRKKSFSIIVRNRNFRQLPAYGKKNSTAQPKVFSIDLKILGFFGCCYPKFAGDQRSQYVKSYFQLHQLSSYFLMSIWESSRVRVLK